MIEIQFQYDPLLTIFSYSFMLLFMIVANRALSSRKTHETRSKEETQ